MRPIFTIGHSNRSATDFVALLRGAGIGLIADIRTIARSRANPQFNQDTLPATLAGCAIAYEHIAALGGLRGKSRKLAPDVNGFWNNDSFHNYADYAMSEHFRIGLDHLIELCQARRCALMCSEAVWWRCHRRIVADYLLARDEAVFHIMERGRLEPARLTAGAVLRQDGTVAYPKPD